MVLQHKDVVHLVQITTENFRLLMVQRSYSLLQLYADEHGLEMGTGCIITYDGETKQLADNIWKVKADCL